VRLERGWLLYDPGGPRFPATPTQRSFDPGDDYFNTYKSEETFFNINDVANSDTNEGPKKRSAGGYFASAQAARSLFA
jgi:hypothetical protein